MDNEIIGKIKYLINKKKSLEEICDILDVKDYELIGMVKLLKEQGHMIDYVDGELIKLKRLIEKDYVYEIPHDLEELKMLLISDTHLCNKSDRLDILEYLYQKADQKGIKHVLHVGDLTDGMYTNRPQQISELRVYGFDEHLKYVVEKYPKADNIKTYFVGGNHMDTYFRNSGSDLGKAISKERDDLVYLNPDTADMKIGKTKIRLHHGSGSKAYSVSYKLQKYAETISADDKVHILAQGHFHNAFYMYYNDIHCYQVGSLEDETPFSRSLGLKNEKSCYWLNVKLDDNGKPVMVETELETFGKKKVRRK